MLFLIMNLSLFKRPSRYIGGEVNSYPKEFRVKDPMRAVRFALCFPDVYEVGMSHLGLKILYDIVNGLPYASAERVFSPWIDLEEYLKRNNILLSSLESNTPLKDFDIVGFSLQHEMSYTTVLNMLDLGGMPISSDERLNSRSLPVVIAGGPCAVNPAPMSEFIDAFLVGDGEDAVVELINLAWQYKSSGCKDKILLLNKISELDGFYVPSVHGTGTSVKRRFVKDLDSAPYPMMPIVPYASIVHDRINIEVSRGCAMGCRFCQAGMIYRPLRERSPERVLEIAEESLKNTGYEEVSFTSLSAGDYSCLLPAIKEFNRRFNKSRIALSLPSLRVGAVNQGVLREIRSTGISSFTIAPEAATERLRIVINKDFSEDDYERALNALFDNGWLNLKLYFMIGLPTETDEDIEGICSMAMKALKIAKRKTGRFVNIGITISPFIPKPHTPFQWCGQISYEEMKRKGTYLKEILSRKKFKYKGHDEKMSFLEAVFARGDEKLSALIKKAWQLGCRLDAWSEVFDFNKWIDAMDKTGIDGPYYAERSLARHDDLAWDNIDIGIRKDFLYREYEKALSGQMTIDCRKTCHSCGLKCKENGVQYLGDKAVEIQTITSGAPMSNFHIAQAHQKTKIRVQFSKNGRPCYLSHLELVSAILRGLRRAGVPLDFSKGFRPSPLVSFGPPLSVGMSGEKEYFDMEVFAPFDIKFYMEKLNKAMPEGINIKKMAEIPMDAPSLNSFIKRYEYLIVQNADKKGLYSVLWDIGSPLIVQRNGKDIDISECIEDVIVISDNSRFLARLIIKDTDKISARASECVKAVFGADMNELAIFRTALYGRISENDEWTEPL